MEYKESDETRELKSQIAEEKPRDEHGHFVHAEHQQQATENPSHNNPISQFIHNETAIHKGNDDELIDVHVGNPLKRIADLLEDIKKQKAFSFNIKGSLGVAGIVLVLGVFGIFGGTKALCNKGIQSEFGVLKILAAQEVPEETFIDKVMSVFHLPNSKQTQRILLMNPQGHLIHLILNSSINVQQYANQNVITTGNYDSCAFSQKVEGPEFIEFFR